MAAFSLSYPLIKYLIAIALVFSFSATALAWGSERTPRRAESTYKHHRHMHQRKTEEADRAFHREYWQPCDSTFREYIVNACNAN